MWKSIQLPFLHSWIKVIKNRSDSSRHVNHVSPEVRCPAITTLKNISLSPPACGKRAVSPGSTCLLTCRQGYALQGNRKAVCLGSGNWTANVYKAICIGKICVWVGMKCVEVKPRAISRGVMGVSQKCSNNVTILLR